MLGMPTQSGYCSMSRYMSVPAMFPSLQVFGLATYSSALITDKPTCTTWLSKEEDDSLSLKERNEIALGTY